MKSSAFEEAIANEDIYAIANLLREVSQEDLNRALLRATLLDNEEITALLLQNEANPDVQDKDGRTPFFNALRLNRPGLCKKLVESGCDVNVQKYNGTNALHFVAKQNYLNYATLLVTHNAKLDMKNIGGNTALLIACRFGNREIAELLLNAGADVNISNHLGHFPLHYAAYFDDGDLITALIQHGASSNCTTYLGVTPIMLACERKNCYAVHTLAESSDLSLKERLYGGSALHWAVNNGCKLCLDHIIENGGDLSMTDFSGRTSLMQAVISNKPKLISPILSTLQEQGVDICQTSDKRVLHLSTHLGRHECICEMLKFKQITKFIHKTDYFQDTPVSLAAKQGHLDIIELLLDHGADPGDCGISQDAVQSPQTKEDILTYNLEIAIKALMKHTTGKARDNKRAFKTYSPIKMALVDLLKESDDVKLVVPSGFDFSNWLDDGPESFSLKLRNIEITKWLKYQASRPLLLSELCRLSLRRLLGYRASEKIDSLPVADTIRHYLNMEDMNDLDVAKIQTERLSYSFNGDDLDIEC